MRALMPYPSYRESGVPWLGKVPAHWEVRRLRTVAEMRISNVDKLTNENERAVSLCNYTDVYNNDRIRIGMNFMKATATADEIERFRLQPGDVLITKDSEAWNDIGVPALVESTEEELISGYHLALLRPESQKIRGAYLHYTLSCAGVADQFHVGANGVTRFGLSQNAIKSIWLPLAPLSEQAAIIRFLDRADRRIRHSIRAKQKLISLLEEQKQVVIHQAVTGRIDVRTGQPYPAYKSSGVEWLGNVPAQWQVLRFGRVISLATGYPFKSENFAKSESDMRLLRGINVAPGRLRWDEVVRWSAADTDAYSEYQVEVGDVILGMDRPFIGSGIRVAMATENDVPSLLLQRAARIRPIKERLEREFALSILGSRNFLNYLSPIFTGISVPHLSPAQIRGFCIALPDITEQRAIVEYLKSQMKEVQFARERTERQIDLLRECRTRLIADAVTGKLDVREAAAALPEEPDDPDAAEADCPEPEGGDDDRCDRDRRTAVPATQEEATS